MLVADYLSLLNIADDEFVGLMWKDAAQIQTAVVPATMVTTYLTHQIPASADAYIAPNPVAGPLRMNAGRGTEEQVTRVSSLYADLDVKPGSCPDIETAHQIIDDLSAILFERPTCVIFSGGGLQPLWALEACEPEAGRLLLARFGRLVRMVAKTRDVLADSVFDSARVLRAPGTLNHKYDPPRETSLIPDAGAPMEPATVSERLDEVGIYALDDDELSAEVIRHPDDCGWAEQTCGYMVSAMREWGIEGVIARHPWLLNRLTRLEAAHRYGCLTRADFDNQVGALGERMAILCRYGMPSRPVARFEVRDSLDWAREAVARKTDEQLGTELGGHVHLLGEPVPTSALAPSPGRSNGSAGLLGGITAGSEVDTQRLKLVRMSAIRTVTPVWAWDYHGYGRIQLGTLCLLAGRPGAGKSTAARWFAAGYSTGVIPGCFHGQPVNVAYFAPAEESWESVIKPALIASGADMTRILTFDPLDEAGNPARLISSTYEAELVQICTANDIRVLIVDPVMSTIPGGTDINRNNETRAYVEPWARIAATTNAVVMGVVHLTKHPGTDLVAAINGSSAFGEVARSVFGFAKDLESTEGDRIMTQAKNSTGPEGLSLIYRITPTLAPMDDGPGVEVPVFDIIGLSDITASDAMEAATEGRLNIGAADEARRWLAEYLEEQGRARPKDVLAAGKPEGHNERTIYRAARKLRVQKLKEGFPAVSFWSLPLVTVQSHQVGGQ